MPSVFAHGILNANPYAFLDDVPLEERRTRAVQMRRTLPQSILETVGKLDQGAIEQVRQQAWPDIRNSDELHDFLQTVIALPTEAAWQPYFEELEKQGRATIATTDSNCFWGCAEKMQSFLTVYPQAKIKTALKRIEKTSFSRDAIILEMIKGWMFYLEPTTKLISHLQRRGI
ncbi:MAG TPA: hypothetical protein PLD88_00780 [Candidatus Berkiella sp.]|nr:hypothetical protein [Candidatus Berkiella sp.]